MFATTTWPIAMTQPHAAPAGPQPPTGPVRRIRVTRRSVVRTHRRRRGVALPPVRRADSYLVRVCRPAGRTAPPILRLPATTPHRVRMAG